MNDTGVIAKTRRVLDGHFPGQRFAVFYRQGDGPDRDITATIPLFDKEAFTPASIIDGAFEDYQQYHNSRLVLPVAGALPPFSVPHVSRSLGRVALYEIHLTQSWT